MSDTQRLSVIMFADMVGYTARMEADQKETLALLTALHELLRTGVERHGGRVWKFIGDAVLAEFTTSALAVECAVAIQEEMRAWNLERPPDGRVDVRIGLHAGDIVERDGDIYGDTVNVAARIQPLASPGGICVSRTVFETVRRTTGVAASSRGFKRLKGIAGPMEVFEIHPDAEAAPGGKTPWGSPLRLIGLSAGVLLAAAALWLAFLHPSQAGRGPAPRAPEGSGRAAASPLPEWKDSIAVLPFKNLSPDAGQEYFCDGMTEQVITDLTRVPDLKVIARTSVMTYKKTDKDIRKIARELGVAHILEGSIRRAGGKIRVTAQLIKAEDGAHVWAKDFDRGAGDIFAVQDAVAQAIVESLKLTVGGGPLMTASDTRPSNLEAYEYYLKGRYQAESVYMISHDENDFRQALAYGRKAVELDPGYALGYMGLALTCLDYGVVTRDAAVKEQGYAYRRKAHELDPDSASAAAFYALVLINQDQFDEGFALCRRAIALNPNDSLVWFCMGDFMGELGLAEDAAVCFRRSADLDPRNYWALHNLAWDLNEMGQWEEALQTERRSLELQPASPVALEGCIYSYLLAGMLNEADRAITRLEGLRGYERQARRFRASYCALRGERERALALAETDDALPRAILGMKDEAVGALRTALEEGRKKPVFRCEYIQLSRHRFYGPLRSDPRFQAILDEQKKRYDTARARYGL